MTCIVALKDRGRVWMGGDSAGTREDWSQLIYAEHKVFTVEKMIFGAAGSGRPIQLLRHAVAFPMQVRGQDPMEFLVTTFVDAVREALHAGGSLRAEWNLEEADFDFILGYRGALYRIDQTFQVIELADPFVCVGSGGPIAAGAMYATQGRRGWTAKGRIQTALEAAARYNATVRPPFVIESVF